MNCRCQLSNVTRNYLDTFQSILDEMICKMTSAQLSDSISASFIRQMIPHHRAAIEMSHNILQYTTCIPVQEIAGRIIEEQTKSIENMQAIINTCQQRQNCPRDVCAYENRTDQIMQVMFSDMGNACTDNNINGNFMREMIPHHEGAIEMSENALMYNICPQLRPILQAIITSQENGVRQMQRLLRCMNSNTAL